MSTVYYDPYKVAITADPYPVFRRLREEAPLYYNEQHDFYAISRFEDVERGLHDRETYSSGRGAILEYIKANAQYPSGVLIFEDPPVHTVHRTLLARLFTPRRISGLDVKIREFCAQCLDPFVGREDFDFIRDLGHKMPMRVIGMLLGIPEKDQDAVRERVDASMRTVAGKPKETNDSFGEGFEEYVDWRATHPSDDVITELMTVEFADETGTRRRLTRDEVLILVNVLAGAGNETTNRLIGWTGKLLGEHPDVRRELAAKPELIPQAIEEVLRFEPPAPHMARYVTRDVELHGRTVPEGSVMMMLPGSANRDDRRFANGDTFDIHRPQRSHLTFGYGIHVCVGSVLARMEGRIALQEVLKRFPDWEVDYANAVLSPTSTVRGWETLPAKLGRSSAPGVKLGPARIRMPEAEEESPGPAPAASPETAKAATLEGTWRVTLEGPTGAIDTVLLLERKDGALTGTQTGQGATSPILDAKFENGEITWINQVTKPMKLKVTFTGKLDGATMSGKAKAGFMGSFPFTAVKTD